MFGILSGCLTSSEVLLSSSAAVARSLFRCCQLTVLFLPIHCSKSACRRASPTNERNEEDLRTRQSVPSSSGHYVPMSKSRNSQHLRIRQLCPSNSSEPLLQLACYVHLAHTGNCILDFLLSATCGSSWAVRTDGEEVNESTRA